MRGYSDEPASQSSLRSLLCLLLPLAWTSIHPSCLWMLPSSRIAVICSRIHNETENDFLLKQTVTQLLWLTLNGFSLDDSWVWTVGTPLPEAQRPRAGCHAQSMSRVAFLLGTSTSDSHDLFMLYLPFIINLSQTWQVPGDWPFFKIKNDNLDIRYILQL